MTKSFGDPAPASGRSKQSSLVRTKRYIKNASKGRTLRQRVRSWDLFAPFFHLHDRQEKPTLPLDHAELYAQTICENAGGNGAYQVLPGMIWDSACLASCRARDEVGCSWRAIIEEPRARKRARGVLKQRWMERSIHRL